MVKQIEFFCTSDELEQGISPLDKLYKTTAEAKGCTAHLMRRWVDARARPVRVYFRYQLYDTQASIPNRMHWEGQQVGSQEAIHIIGAGPAGLFAALQCIELGYKPIVMERGKDVQERRRDLRAIQQEGLVHPDSNYCFGEGGAGTYSDGKLYTRSKNRGDVQLILDLLIQFGAEETIGIDAHPHIGSNKLPKIIAKMREHIIACGGEVVFNARVSDIVLNSKNQVEYIMQNGSKVPVKHLILATGHSARDIYELFLRKAWAIEAKPFALGLRIEHPQGLIDEMQYGSNPRPEVLPAAPYSFSTEIKGRGVFSFCMCPGGLIVPAATAPGEIVVNGMSLSKRDSPFANSGMVVAVQPEDLTYMDKSVRACLSFQEQMEQQAFSMGNGSQAAPAQRMVDFIDHKHSNSLPITSYIPGLYSTSFKEMLPKFLIDKLRAGLIHFSKKKHIFMTNEAVLVGFESRTSAPFSIPRNPSTLKHVQIENLYPTGEGAGYAGGIMSAAMDGMRVARAIVQNS